MVRTLWKGEAQRPKIPVLAKPTSDHTHWKIWVRASDGEQLPDRMAGEVNSVKYFAV